MNPAVMWKVWHVIVSYSFPGIVRVESSEEELDESTVEEEGEDEKGEQTAL